MNILILSCGTRNKLVSYFMESGYYEKVVVTDCSEQAPALYEASKYYIVPRMKEEGYLPCILEICKQEKIDMVLPLQEDELLLMAQNKTNFLDVGVKVIVSNYEKVLLCKDKYKLNSWLLERGISAVPTFLAEELLGKEDDVLDLFVKPRFGAGSINTMAVRSKKMLEALVCDTEEELIIQPRMRGKEFGVDIYVDMLSGQIVSCFCKEKLRMRAGETEKSLSVKNTKLTELATKAVRELGLIGPVDLDVMEQEGEYFILEINPRFGGGYPHAHVCGIHFPKYISQNGQGKINETESLEYPENVLVMKYSEIIVK